MIFTNLTFVCTQCKRTVHRPVRYWPNEGYAGEVTCSIWCPHCRRPQVIIYGFQWETGEAVLVEHLKPTSVLSPKQPTGGLTVSPRKKRPR
jgi:hypothetical protein